MSLKDRKQPCTCLGSCKGPDGLGEGWVCALTLPAEAKSVGSQPDKKLRAFGVTRMHDNDQAILVSFNRKPTDDELRDLHDTLAGRLVASSAGGTIMDQVRAEAETYRIGYVDGALGHEPQKPLTDPQQAMVKAARTPSSATLATGPLTLDTDRQVFFYEQDNYPLSNFSSFRLRWLSLDFDTSEHSYHWMRFLPGSPERAAILMARSAHEAFRFAQENKHRQRPDWESMKVDVMRDILRAKAGQHEYVRRKLLQTGDRELVENSHRDPFWGWGPNRDGKNMLGRLWMEVRDELRASVGPSAKDGAFCPVSGTCTQEPVCRWPCQKLGTHDVG